MAEPLARRGWKGLAALLLLSGMVTAAPAPAEAQPPPGAWLSGWPTTELVDGQRVGVSGYEFEPNSHLEIFQCRGGAVDERDCDGYTVASFDVDADGSFHMEFRIDTRFFLPSGDPVDCRTVPEGCEIGVGFVADADQWPEIELHFRPDVQPDPWVHISAWPTTGLKDGDVVKIHGEKLSAQEEAFAYLCRSGRGDLRARCDLDRMVKGVPEVHGSINLQLTVRPRFTTPLGNDIDCTTVAGGCEVVISAGFGTPPDRWSAEAVSFVVDPTTTTTTTTTPTSKPTAKPAMPIERPARFTG